MNDVRYNIMNIDSVNAFLSIKGRINNHIKDVYFAAFTGTNNDCNTFRQTGMSDQIAKVNNCNVLRINNISKSVDDISLYSKCYDEWINENKINIKVSDKINISVLNKAFKKIIKIFEKDGSTPSITKNFVIKLMYRCDIIVEKILNNSNNSDNFKIIYYGELKKQEILFLYMMTMLGYDVGIYMPSDYNGYNDTEIKKDMLIFPANDINSIYLCNSETRKDVLKPVSNIQQKEKVKITIPPKTNRKNSPINNVNSSETAAAPPVHNQKNTSGELDFESLAKLASSVVMILVCDEKGNVMASGSGIMIGRKGFILTNNHVIAGGSSFAVKIENDDNTYYTNEIIKYHSNCDLAVIRINRQLDPLPFYSGKDLARGQKVVAIGSPLGFFNSVSDGIISGFRSFADVDMIQFTAPVSGGSSGGALLNMQGEVIGIVTSGYNDAQNINLAVKYDIVNNFIRGFIS